MSAPARHDRPALPRFEPGPELSLYVHLPWCVKKCPYCDFNSHALRSDTPLPTRAYTDALLREFDDQQQRLDRLGDRRPITSVFFGGGTPSLFPAADIARVIDAARATRLAAAAEITLEANPGAIEHGRVGELRAAGVNRLSLGAQSFDAAALKRLGRIHGPDEIRSAFGEARAAGFDNINLDLMYGLPEQDAAGALADLEAALALAPEHLSHYQLTLEPNTLFAARPPALPDSDAVWAMQTRSARRLADAGYRQYEVSAWAQTGRECRHNLNYWRFGDYLGIGAGAHGKLAERLTGVTRRDECERHPQTWLQRVGAGSGVRRTRAVADADLCFEYPLNLLRLKDEALCAARFERATGVAFEALQPAVEQAVARGLLRPAGERCWTATTLGWRFLNDLQAIFLPRQR